jgi:hypothetical protein
MQGHKAHGHGLPQHRRCAIHRCRGAVSPRTTATDPDGTHPTHSPNRCGADPPAFVRPIRVHQVPGGFGSRSGTPRLRATLLAQQRLSQGLPASQRINGSRRLAEAHRAPQVNGHVASSRTSARGQRHPQSDRRSRGAGLDLYQGTQQVQHQQASTGLLLGRNLQASCANGANPSGSDAGQPSASSASLSGGRRQTRERHPRA